MVGVSGIGFYAEPANPRRVNELRTESDSPARGVTDEPAPSTDGATLGAAALLLAKASEQDDPIREQRIEQIRQSLEHGTHRLQEVLLKVAARIGNFVQ